QGRAPHPPIPPAP
uniref:Bradykinin-potentiating peptide 13d n=4 Tax=Crotalinae TaxID=8710 RepID=BPPDD_BOTJA|nr:RecName: Full=Bradykinin-potentiating peptide 13d; Short=BPP-13d [Bothrops jararaca]